LADLKFSDGKSIAISSGFEEIDRYGGFFPGEFIVIGSRPSMGKTLMLVSMAMEMAKELPLLYFSFESSQRNLAARFMSALTDISAYKIIANIVSDDELQLLESARDEFARLNIHISESCRNSISSFKAYCEKMIAEKGIKVIMVDHLQLMSSNRYSKGRDMELGYISQELKNIAKENNVCVIASSQLSRSLESRSGDKRPVLSDLRDSGNIEQDADKVYFVHRPEYYGIVCDSEGNSLVGMVTIIFSKNKNGPTGDINLRINKDKTRIKSLQNFSMDFEILDSRLKEIDITLDSDSFDFDKRPF
jgi:replicative DNA helicase